MSSPRFSALARVLRRIENELARELDRRNAPVARVTRGSSCEDYRSLRLPEHERAESLMFALAKAKMDVALLATRRPDDRRWALLATILEELPQAVYLEDDTRALAGAERGPHGAPSYVARRPFSPVAVKTSAR